MNKEIKALFKAEEGSLKINEFCTLNYYLKDALGNDNNGSGHLMVEFKCYYGKAWHSAIIESREPNEIKEAIKREQTHFFEELRDMLNKQVDGGVIK